MGRKLFLLTVLVFLAGCTRILEPILAPGLKAFVSPVIVDVADDKVQIEAGWTVSRRAIRKKAEDGCKAQSEVQDDVKRATNEISSLCGGIACLTTVHLFGCKTDAEMKALKALNVDIVPKGY